MGSNMLSLSSTNHAPTETEAQNIHAFLATADEELAKLDIPILKAALRLAELTAMRNRRNESLAPLRAVLSPLRRFPPEILGEIFQWCRDNSLASIRYSITDPMKAPVLLGHICSSWRSVAHGTPRLWDTINCQVKYPQPSLLAPYLCALAAKSRHLPLSTDLVAYTSFSPMDVISTVSQRLQKIHLNLDDRGFDFASMPLNTSYPILTSIDIEITDTDGTNTRRPDGALILRNFRAAPCLQHLGLDAPSMDNFLNTRFSWAQLTSLDLHVAMDIFTARRILTQCSQLTTCTMQDVHPSDDDEPELPICVLSDMSFFNFSAPDEGGVEAFFQPLSFPRLEYLSIDACLGGPELLDFHARSRFIQSLTQLDLCIRDLPEDELIPFLGATPLLVTLILKYCVSNRIFEAFTCGEIDLPRLTSLTLDEITDHLDGDVVVSMVESLWQPDNSPRTVFPSLAQICLVLDGRRFSNNAEVRLAQISSTGFLVDNIRRC
ncbi:hypothetical protein DFH09DRAFT_489459 [Mycena vulgaris]|nr:hypothetical protein DFH09DRAFT_489459 [Mycena vulgaris]